MSIPEDAWREAVEAIRGAQRAALACHLNPDGDAIGSMLAFGLLLRRMGKEVVASWGNDPFEVPRAYAFLPGLEMLVSPDRFPSEPELMVTFDCAAPDRLGPLEPVAARAAHLVVVDHHALGSRFGQVQLVDPDAAASAVLVRDLARRLGVALDRDAAVCLYTGLSTDSGSFKYRNTTPAVHELAAELLSFDIAHDEIARALYDTHPVGFLKLAGLALQRAEVDPAASLIWTWVARADLAEFGIGPEDTDGLIDLIRTADVAEVACVLRELPDGKWKASLRAKGEADVGALAQSFGGGGHALAAGFTAEDSDRRRVVAAIAARLSGERSG